MCGGQGKEWRTAQQAIAKKTFGNNLLQVQSDKLYFVI